MRATEGPSECHVRVLWEHWMREVLGFTFEMQGSGDNSEEGGTLKRNDNLYKKGHASRMRWKAKAGKFQ